MHSSFVFNSLSFPSTLCIPAQVYSFLDACAQVLGAAGRRPLRRGRLLGRARLPLHASRLARRGADGRRRLLLNSLGADTVVLGDGSLGHDERLLVAPTTLSAL